jgi:sensor histidine kinase regulating citrate/malate metabolism
MLSMPVLNEAEVQSMRSTRCMEMIINPWSGEYKIVIWKNTNPRLRQWQWYPPDLKDKIFQPFFTTKPTGQGTGLGLSLSYDIVKSHGGELEVNSTEGEGTEFVIQLPVV